MSVYVFRHGEVYNPQSVIYGRLPGFHLTDQGKASVTLSAQTLIGAKISEIFSSPLERAVETSQIICTTLGLTNRVLRLENLLVEIDCRHWEGKPVNEFMSKTLYSTNRMLQDDIEPLLDAGKRLMKVLDSIATNKNVILVSHGDPIMGLVVELTGDWDAFYHDYIDKGHYIKLDYSNNRWHPAAAGL